jgi:hypothetical protein
LRAPIDDRQVAERLNGLLVLQPDDASVLAATVRMSAEQALRAVIVWRFNPARLNAKPVAASMGVAVNFTLR